MVDVVNQQNGEQVTIEISDFNKLVAASIKEKVRNLSPSPFGKSCCIYRVHDKFRKINEYAYTPQIISIGPFHHGKIGLLAMEDHKVRYMNTLLSRTSSPPDTKLDECIESIKKLEERIRRCYSEPISFESKELVEMIVIDGLFIIELFGKSAGVFKIDRDDSIFYNIWGMPSLVRDMILLENQLPMFVLKCLFKQVKETLPDCAIGELALRFFDPLMQRDLAVLQKHYNQKGKHLLDLLSNTFRGVPPADPNKLMKLKHVPSVTELRQAGVKFKRGSATGSFVNIKFTDGVLEIPCILIQDQTDTLLRNLIASEQCCDGRSTYMTSYAFLMDSLINSPADVRILRLHGIITNYLGDDEDVSCLFNRLCSEVTLVNFYYSELCDEVNSYYRARWHVWQATLKRDYFHNPWAIFSFVGAILLLILTLTATVFAALDFFVKSK